MKNFFKIAIGVLLLGIFIWTIYFLYSKSEDKPLVFKTSTPFKTTIIKKTVATGSVVPRKEIDIKPQVSGIVDKIFVEAGNTVKKGDKKQRFSLLRLLIDLHKRNIKQHKTILTL